MDSLANEGCQHLPTHADLTIADACPVGPWVAWIFSFSRRLKESFKSGGGLKYWRELTFHMPLVI